MSNKWKALGVLIFVLISYVVWNQSHAGEPEYQPLGEGSKDQEIKNIEAFTKLYGYIRYFHPSDEVAELDWNTFAVYGVEEVKSARDQFELKDKLEDLFKPIAPTIDIYRDSKNSNISTISKDGEQRVFWQHKGLGTTESTLNKSKRVYQQISSNELIDPLFQRYPKDGERAEVSLGQGIQASVPLILHSKQGQTIGSTEESKQQFDKLKQNLQEININVYDVEKIEGKWAGITIAWNAIKHFYPYLDEVDAHWDKELTTTLKSVKEVKDTSQYVNEINRMLVPLKDGQANAQTGQPPIYTLPINVQWVDKELTVVNTRDNSDFKVGDVLLSRDGLSVDQFVKREKEVISGSSHWRQYVSGKRFIQDQTTTTSEFNVRRDGQTITIKDKFSERRVHITQPGNIDEYHRPEGFKELKKGFWYVNALGVKMNQTPLEDHIMDLTQAEGIILDFRGAPFGHLMDLIPHIIDETNQLSTHKQPHILYPVHIDKEKTYSRNSFRIKPKSPNIDAPIIFLVDHSSSSGAESFLKFFEEAEIGEFVGRPSRGAIGYLNRIQLPNYINVSFTGTKVITDEGEEQFHANGIEPDYPVEPSRRAILEEKDVFIEKALEVLESKQK
ncbi:S41 family peptidase [Pontibacillus yanchengensis]|uniref:Tail specific protease domain-containing protein n=1 Tax=Pontibacillus yanchengensis Y32 TaxID=1385514 RepID=A0A0A2T5A1_9BACI|nr:S41 family peptidase [Pontibacillus yanchengensis]KGP70952.1 hypothetical protein N782_02640 [Pontibacillus yanchengensis Y32]